MSEATEPMTLYRHVKRQQWGLAILASEGPNRRRFQFQDGRIRTFKKGFYDLLEVVDEEPDDDTIEVLADLKKKLDIAQARKEAIEQAGGSTKNAISFDDQIRVFKMMYPKGFQDPAWIEGIRGEDSTRRLKRHRHQVLVLASEELVADKLNALVDSGSWEDLRETLVGVLQRTDLVRPSADLQPIDELAGEGLEAFGRATVDLLHGDGDFDGRFDRFLESITPENGDGPTWQLVTVLPALVHPDDHVCVRPSSFRRQAKWLRPRLRYTTRPSSKLYREFREMAHEARKQLEHGKMQPRDMMDIYDFIRVTLAPKALKRLKGN